MTPWSLSFKPTFLHESFDLPKAVQKKIKRICKVLERDPISANGDAKKLKGYRDPVYRVRLGDYRLFYSLGDGWIKLLSIRKRDDRTYEIDLTDTAPPDLDPDLARDLARDRTPDYTPTPPLDYTPEQPPNPPPPARPPDLRSPLPIPLTRDRLRAWNIAPEHWPTLQTLPNAEALLECDLPEAIVQRILDNLYPRDLSDIATQPEYILNHPDDLDRLFSGDLTAFLLKLDPDQQRLCNWGNNGPVVVKGSAGTGKSILALHRVKTLKTRGYQRILFTTYTNALVRYSEQLLQQLLGPDLTAQGITVTTVDALAVQTYRDCHGHPNFAQGNTLQGSLHRALERAPMPGPNRFAQQARRTALSNLGPNYLLAEILDFIEGHGIPTLDAYQATPRPGRGIALNAKMRTAVWALYETWQQDMANRRQITWPQLRRRALEIARDRGPAFDAIVLDEAQDLSPVALRFLLAQVPDFNGLYFTADASQSIYQRSFSWPQIHADLNLRGRTLILKRNYRNTAAIVAACDQLLGDSSAIDSDDHAPPPHAPQTNQPQIPQPSGPIPQLLQTDDFDQEIAALHNFFLTAARRHRLPLHGGAVLCPTHALCDRYATALTAAGLQAQAVSGKAIDLSAPHLKVLTLHSAKGLEFPFVAVVGLSADHLPYLPPDSPPEEQAEHLASQRRLLYVGCSRAMRSLLVCASRDRPSAFLPDLVPPTWATLAT